jgi:hypothetical protein
MGMRRARIGGRRKGGALKTEEIGISAGFADGAEAHD